VSHLKVVVDGEVLMDADPGTWSSEPPDLESLKGALASRGGENQPWMMSILYTLATLLPQTLMGQDVGSVVISVSPKGGRYYDMSVSPG